MISCSTCSIAVSIWPATSAGTSSVAMLTKLTSLGSILAARSTPRAEHVGEAARLLDADALALEVGHRLDVLLTTIEASSFGMLARIILVAAPLARPTIENGPRRTRRRRCRPPARRWRRRPRVR